VGSGLDSPPRSAAAGLGSSALLSKLGKRAPFWIRWDVRLSFMEAVTPCYDRGGEKKNQNQTLFCASSFPLKDH